MEIRSQFACQYRLRNPIPHHELLDRLSYVQDQDLVLWCLCYRMLQLDHNSFPIFLPLTFQLAVEVIGYIGRALAVNNTGELGPFVIQATFILLPPAFFAASIYMILARIIRAVDGDHLSIINPRLVTKIFVFGDWASIGV
jgi:hypothetical protein